MKSNDEKKKTVDTLFYSPDLPNSLQLPEQESQHAIKVLRLSTGDQIAATDGKGFFYNCTIVDAHHKRCILKINQRVEEQRQRNYNITIAFSPTKNNNRNEWFAEKATEIGIDSFIPMKCQFSERKSFRTDRFERVTVAAMKQSQQATLPTIHELTDFKDIIQRPFEGQKYIAHCYDDQKHTLNHYYKPNEDALILIGPEGDFSHDEVQTAIEAGFIPISLGHNRLRTETAALIASHTIHILNFQ